MKLQNILSQTVTFVLAGGRGERLAPLTNDRSKPAVPFGDGRIIDFALANCLRSKIEHPFVITQYQAAHLTQHVRRWRLEQSALPAEASTAPVCVPAPAREYSGTADALFRNLHLLKEDARYVMVLSADHIYDMDYRGLLQFHADRDADATLATIVHPSESSRQFGIVEVDQEDRIRGFEEKPAQPKQLPGHPGKVLANMGIYVFRKDVFVDTLRRDAADLNNLHDIGRNILPGFVGTSRVHAYRFSDRQTGRPGYWRDVGTIDSYYEASMDWLTSLPAGRRPAGLRSVVAEGVRIHPTAEVVDSILLPGAEVGPRARVRRAILDENVRVLHGAQIGCGDEGHAGFTRSLNGIVVVPANSIITASAGLHAKHRRELHQLRERFA